MFRQQLLSLVVLIAAAFLATGTTETSSSDRSSASSDSASRSRVEQSLEYKLAVIHRGGYVREDDPLVMSFGRVLDRLVAKCPENRAQLADMGVKGRDLLREKNINEPLLEVFRNWRASIPDEAQDGEVGPCSQILSAYIVLRIGQ